MKIAVVGIGCHYPGANSGKELFENILSGRRYFREIPNERWSSDDYYHPDRKNPDTTYCKQAAVIEGFEFNPSEFKIPRSTYMATDQAQWLALQVAQEALRDANLKSIDEEKTAVIIGNTLTGEVSRASLIRYRWPYAKKVFSELLDNFGVNIDLKKQLLEKIEHRYKKPFPPINEDNLAGGLSNTIAGRIANFFDFKGGAFTTDGACSSSLLAINQSCMGLERGDFDVALTGGVDISLDPFEIVGFAKVGALSDDDIRVYDQNSSGFLPGEGCGIVVLKRLNDAIADNDKIYAVVNGVGISSDGKGGITAPSITGQSLAVDRAYESAAYSFADVELIEGHGTGTQVGDGVELNTFMAAKLRHGANGNHHCGIGSIKSNIGHTKAAAGVAGFIKTVLSVYYGILPPTKGIRTPNLIFKETDHLFPLITAKPWPLNKTRRAAVSSAGFGGINTHITLASVKENHKPGKEDLDALLPLMHSYQDSEIFFIGAKDLATLKENILLLLTAAARISHAELVDLAQYCIQNFEEKNLRLGIVAASPTQLNTRLSIILNYLGSVTKLSGIDYINVDEGIFIKTVGQIPRVSFLFPGQGSQYLNMGSLIKSRDKNYHNSWQESDEILRDKLEEPLSHYVFRETDLVDKNERDRFNRKLNDTRIAQPAITVASMAMAEYLGSLGIVPDFSIGHSLGEYTALWNAGVLDKKSTLELVAVRGDVMSKSANVPGAMLSIGASAKEVKKLISEVIGYTTISNYNSPKQTVVSGEESAIESVYELSKHYGFSAVRLPVSSAFHSKLMDNAAEQMHSHLEGFKFNDFDHFVISSMTGKILTKDNNLKNMLVDQIIKPVNFIEAINSATKEDCHCFIEVGPGSVLSNLTKRIIDNDSNYVFSTDIGLDGNQSLGFNGMVAYLYACGLPLKTEDIYKDRFFRPISLPYKPKFIVSPCEIPISELDLNLDGLVNFENMQSLNDLQDSTEAYTSLPEKADNLLSSSDLPNVSALNTNHSPESIFKFIQKFIAEEYGYSVDMITQEAKLQADLGLDSLKSVEVAFEAMGQLGLRGDANKFGDVSLIEIATYLYDLVSGKVDNISDTEKRVIDSPQADWVRAFGMVMSLQEITSKKRTLVDGKVLIISPSKMPFLTKIESSIKKLGFTSELVTSENHLLSNKSIVGCIVVADNTNKSELLSDMNIDTRLYVQPNLLLKAAKILINSDVAAEGKFFVYVTERGGKFGVGDNIPANIDMTAGAGFVRSLHLENPMLQTRVIDFNPDISALKKSALLSDELCHGEGHVDAGYVKPNVRVVPKFTLCPTATLEAQINGLKRGDTVIVTGGGKGITAECVLALADVTDIQLAILGSSPLPDAGSLEEKQDKNVELIENIERFKQQGITHKYYQCDVLDIDNIARVIDAVKVDLGEIKGVIHAAGLNILHRIDNVEWTEFLKVLRPKMEGLLNIVRAVDLEKLKHLSVFSSIIGHSGMMGNSDYAYANEWMSLLLRRIQIRYPNMQCQSFDFSVWSDVGMGANLGSIDILQSIGVSAIPLKEGVQKFVEMSTKIWPDTDMIVSSRVGGLDTINFLEYELPKQRFLEKVLYHQPGVELISEIFLDPNIDNYLVDHDYEGSLLFPAVIGIEAMVECCMACLNTNDKPLKRLPVLSNLSFDRAIIVPPQGRSIRIYVQISDLDVDNKKVANVIIRSSVTNYEVDYFSAECLWQENEDELTSVELNKETKPLSLIPAEDLYGKILFQGPMFQNIESYQELSEKHCVVKIKIPESKKLFPPEKKYSSIFGSAEVRDTFLHAVQICVPQYRILPVAIEKICYQEYQESQVILYAKERFRTKNEFVYDLKIYNSEGNCVETILGFKCRIMGNYEDQDNLSTIYSAHKEFSKKNSKEAVALQ